MSGKIESKKDFIHLLHVEDTAADREMVKRSLNKYLEGEYQVWSVDCVAGAEAVLSNQSIDLILLDMGLPDTIDGRDSFDRVAHAKEEDTPIIILSSMNDHELASSLVDEGAQDYVRKSVIMMDPQVLCDAITFALSRNKTLIKETHKIAKQQDMINWITGSYSIMK